MKKCKICKSKITSFYDSNLEIIFHYCLNCNFIFKDKKFVIPKKEEKEQYEKHENSLENEGYVNFLQKFIDQAIKPYLNPNYKVLDYGCGPNPVLTKLLNINQKQINIYDPYFYPDIDKLIKNYYNIILSSEVCEHFLNPIKEFKLLKSLLKNDGLLCLRTEFHPSNLIKFKNWWYRRELTHISFYNLKTFKKISEILDFKIIDTNARNYIVLKK